MQYDGIVACQHVQGSELTAALRPPMKSVVLEGSRSPSAPCMAPPPPGPPSPPPCCNKRDIAVLNNELECAGRAAFETRCQTQAALSSDVSGQTTDSSMLMPP